LSRTRDGKHGTKLIKAMIMKKIFVFLLLSLVAVSCYDDYIFDYTYSGIYFPYQMDVRTFVVGEGMKIEVGATLGGVRENVKDRNVKFTFDNTLITPLMLAKMQGGATYIKDATTPVAALLPMPANYYTLSNSNTIVIKKGQHMGSIVVRPDSAAFLADAATINATYVLPFSITEADADTVIQPKKTAVIGLKYENMLFGKYWHGGSALVNRPLKSDTTLKYYTVIPQPESKVWILKTVGPNTLYANGYFDQVTAKNEMMLALSGTDITVTTVAGSTWPVTADGASTFNRSKLLQNRKIILKYKYTNTVNGYTYHCTDTLTFRNRIRDGVNEWQDSDPSHYTK
jgi:hypothetical protein